jgi:hypothetical protein
MHHRRGRRHRRWGNLLIRPIKINQSNA